MCSKLQREKHREKEKGHEIWKLQVRQNDTVRIKQKREGQKINYKRENS
jgi:hypothetical protein